MFKQKLIFSRRKPAPHRGLGLALVPAAVIAIAPVPRYVQSLARFGLGNTVRQRLQSSHDFGPPLWVSNIWKTFFEDPPIVPPHIRAAQDEPCLSSNARSPCRGYPQVDALAYAAPMPPHRIRPALCARCTAVPRTGHCVATKRPFWPYARASASASRRFLSGTLNRRRVRFSSRGSVATSLDSDMYSLRKRPECYR